MKSLTLTLETFENSEFCWRLDIDEPAKRLRTGRFMLDQELTVLVRGVLADPRSDNAARLGLQLGQTFGVGDLAQALNEATDRVESTCLYLDLPTEVAHYPWELAVLRSQDEPLALKIPLLRNHKSDTHLGVYLNQCVLVSPHCQGTVRDRTLYSSTRRLARKESVEVMELDPPSSASLRRILKNGVLAIHFQGVNEDLITLDDGVFKLGDLGFSQNAWLVNLGGTAASFAGAQELMDRGVAQTLWRSFDVFPRSQAIFERSFYHALADGDAIATAVFRARNSVAQSDPAQRYQAASYALTVKGDEKRVATESFPPSQVKQIETLNLNESLLIDQLRQPLQNLREVPSHPVPLSVFVDESIHVLRGQLESPVLRESRKAALKRLAIRHTTQKPEVSLPSDPTALRTFLEDLVGVEDQGLNAPQNRGDAINELADHLGLDASSIAGLVHLLRTHHMIRLDAEDFEQARLLVRGLAESIYGFCPRFFAHDSRETFFDGPVIRRDGSYHPGGGFSRTLSSHWRRDETAALQPDLPRPATRLPSLGRVGQGWHIFKGSWVVIETAASWRLDEEETIARAIQNRVFEGLNEMGRPFRLAVPRDFRVIFLGRSATKTSCASIRTVNLDAIQSHTDTRDRWSRYLTDAFGPPSGISEVQYRSAFIERFETVLHWLRLFNLATRTEGDRLIGTAYAVGGEVEAAIHSALRISFGDSTTKQAMERVSKNALAKGIQKALDGDSALLASQKIAAIDLLKQLNIEPPGASQEQSPLSPRETLNSILRIVKPRGRADPSADRPS